MTGPFTGTGGWLRCQLHSHTTNSDGDATPQGLVDHYARAGFDVLAITWPKGARKPTIEHIKNAFEAVGRGQMFR